jgi:hypothetical protein
MTRDTASTEAGARSAELHELVKSARARLAAARRSHPEADHSELKAALQAAVMNFEWRTYPMTLQQCIDDAIAAAEARGCPMTPQQADRIRSLCRHSRTPEDVNDMINTLMAPVPRMTPEEAARVSRLFRYGTPANATTEVNR